MDFTPGIAAGGSIGFFALLAGLILRMVYLQNQREAATQLEIRQMRDDHNKEIDVLRLANRRQREENDWCRERVNILIFACQKGGIEVPKEVWDGPPAP